MTPGILARRTGRAGFTLVEVLLTVLIMSGILVSVSQILYAARISRDTIHNLKETQLAGPAIMDMLERDLRGLLTYDRTRQDHLRVTNRVMTGLDADSLDFVTTTDNLVLRMEGERFIRSDLNEVGYRLRPNPALDEFLELYRREDMGVDEEPFDGGEFSFLHDRVKSFDVQVFEDDGPDAEPLDEWGQTDDEHIGLPARLEVSLTLELSPRIAREQLGISQVRKRVVTFKRVIRLPELLRVAEELIVVPTIPSPPSGDAGTPGAGEGSGTPGTPTDPETAGAGSGSGR